MKIRWTTLLLTLTAAAPLLADEVKLTLVDGSVIVAEIESLHNGNYTLTSRALGTMTVKASDIRRIEMTADASAARPVRKRHDKPADTSSPPPAAPAAVADQVDNPQVGTLQRRIVEDESLMAGVLSLQDDPQVQAILADPEIMAAIRAGDLSALASNPKLRDLLDNPAVQNLNRHLAP